MSDFVFISPGVQFKEKDLTFVTTSVGLTTLGMVGETDKGPAFEAVKISNKREFRTKFGSKSIDRLGNNLKVTLPYYADSYLSESNQLYVTRVLGLSGYDAGKAWVITASGDTNHNNMAVAVLRSKATYDGATFAFNADSIAVSDIMGAGTNPLADFQITVTKGVDTFVYTVSLDAKSPNYISNVLGNGPKNKTTPVYVEAIYPQLINKLSNDNNIFGVTGMTEINDPSVSNYNEEYQTPLTPWVVSQLRGTSIERLFRFVSISDGSSANREIKISIQNIDFDTKEFDVIVRDFNDSDNNVVILESFTRCSLNVQSNNYIGKRIGTVDNEYQLRSNYIIAEISPDISVGSLPCGFEGYKVRTYAGLVSPKMIYKKSYLNTDKVRRTYLGISEKAFDGLSSRGNGINQDMFKYIGSVTTNLGKTKGFHLDINVNGLTGVTDGDYVLGEFEGGIDSFSSLADQNDTNNLYYDRLKRKFTLVPAGGFDGWDEHRNSRTNTDQFKPNSTLDFPESDYYAYLKGIKIYDNPEQISITLFATPGINFFDNLTLVNEAIEMVEEERADSLYIIDAPDLSPSDGYAQELVDLLDDTGIDSNYSATYGPWIEVVDSENGVNVFIPPTGEVLRAIAYTDNKAYPWYAPAGLNRGSINARRTRRILKKSEKDTLYAGRINTMVYFPETGVSIFGQKTLQVADSALDRINVRRLLLELRKLISNVAVRLLFEQNDQTVIDEFKTKVNPILDNIRRERGLTDARIVMDSTLNTPESIDRNELYGEIYIKPTPALEFIGIGFTIMPTGATFQNI